MNDAEHDRLAELHDLIEELEGWPGWPELLRELLDSWPYPLTPAQRAALGDVVTVH